MFLFHKWQPSQLHASLKKEITKRMLDKNNANNNTSTMLINLFHWTCTGKRIDRFISDVLEKY